MVFAGFARVTPALRRVLQTLGKSAAVLEREVEPPGVAECVYCGADFSEELRAVARGVRHAFERRPSASIGVFVPDLSTNRGFIERAFEQVFYPAGVIGKRRQELDPAFHINAAASLAEYPFVAGARLLLRLTRSRIPAPDAGAILRSRWIKGAETERNARAMADLTLRRLRELDVAFGDLQWCAKECPLLTRSLQQVRQLLLDKPTFADYGRWSEAFSDILSALGWPGDSELSEQEKELAEMWKDKLSRLASLTLISGKANLDDALARLDFLLEERGPETGDFFSPIQILDAAEASGLRFDWGFAAGLSETQKFFTRATSALIPLQLQSACDLPSATAASALEHAREAVANLFRSAPRVAATYSGRMHPAAQSYMRAPRQDWTEWEGRTAMEAFVPADVERISDTNAPPYMGDGHSLGGTGLLKDQSQCPFRAFAVRRLHARCPEDGSFGMDSRDRGGFAHAALKLVWDEIKTQERLKTYPPLLLPSLVGEAVEQAVRTHDQGPLHEQLSIAEKERLIQVVLDWLRIESARRISFTVEKTEEKRALDIAGLHLDVRIDRVDRLRNGKSLLIDYKSGEASANKLNGQRPKEPQLLAYATTMRDEVDGFFFGQLKPREARLLGFARDTHIAGQKPPSKPFDWDEYLDGRLEVVERLAESFVAGEAAVDPLYGACEYCDVGPFCRVSEVKQARREDGNDE
ncbi:MAG TPA: PD-(D/E)XK nuclease family protein, partial [Bryobacteraceae bacterium]|nr:PD-(D/E)XK nuclease family protein [Bryobacteraceae bacterium]